MMKITAGLGQIDDYEAYVAAGADELFVGYVPKEWMEKYGIFVPLNRREVMYYHVQIGSLSELRILRDKIRRCGVPVSITLNALYYLPEQYSLLASLVKDLMQEGFTSFIVADPALLIYLHQQLPAENLDMHISGEMAEVNSYFVSLCQNLGARRIIFHRKTTADDMYAIIHRQSHHGCKADIKNNASEEQKMMAYEAFVMNEMCHYHGGFCNTLHCDELCHMCYLPWKIAPLTGSEDDNCETSFVADAENEDHEMQIVIDAENEDHEMQIVIDTEDGDREIPVDSGAEDEEIYIPGASGCGLCSLWDLRDAGVNWLKVVGRGNYSEDMARDIRALKTALEILESSPDKTTYINRMQKAIFPHGCSGVCYTS